MAGPWEMDWGGDTAKAPAAKEPWEMDWGTQPAVEPRSFMTKLGETSWGKFAKSAADAFTLPGDVYAGRVDPSSDEGIQRSLRAATFMTPVPAAMRAGEGIFAVPIRAKPDAVVAPSVSAATTAVDIGAPLPRGLASDSRIMQSTTRAAQQLPMVGPKIGEQVSKTVEAAGGAVNDIADQMAGGVVDRASAGAAMRPAVKGVIENNNSRIDEAFSSLRGMLDQSEPVLLPTTEKILGKIIKDRQAAGHTNPVSGLEDVHNLVTNGATFDGLQRARSDIGNSLKFGEANPGFNAGDLKRIYGAMSNDMAHVVSQSAKEGVNPGVAVDALRSANSISAPLMEFNKTLEKLSGVKTDEGLIGSLAKAAQDKTGNVKLLAQLRNSMPKEDFEQIGGVALSELGHNAAAGKFSLNQFAKKWDQMGDRAKSVLFSPEHKQTLDNIAQMGLHLKDTDKFTGTSNTGAIQAWAKLIVGGASAVAALTYGDPTKLVAGLAAAGGGLFLARQLAKPATASSIEKWTRAAVLAEHGQSASRLAAFRLSTRNLLNNLDQTQTSLPQSRTPQPQ